MGSEVRASSLLPVMEANHRGELAETQKHDRKLTHGELAEPQKQTGSTVGSKPEAGPEANRKESEAPPEANKKQIGSIFQQTLDYQPSSAKKNKPGTGTKP